MGNALLGSYHYTDGNYPKMNQAPPCSGNALSFLRLALGKHKTVIKLEERVN